MTHAYQELGLLPYLLPGLKYFKTFSQERTCHMEEQGGPPFLVSKSTVVFGL